MAVAGLALGAVAVGAGVVYLLESPTSPVPYATSRETPHEAGPLKGILQGIPDLMWPENKNPFGPDGSYYEHKAEWEQYPKGQFGVDQVGRSAPGAVSRSGNTGQPAGAAGASTGLSAVSGPASASIRSSGGTRIREYL